MPLSIYIVPCAYNISSYVHKIHGCEHDCVCVWRCPQSRAWEHCAAFCSIGPKMVIEKNGIEFRITPAIRCVSIGKIEISQMRCNRTVWKRICSPSCGEMAWGYSNEIGPKAFIVLWHLIMHAAIHASRTSFLTALPQQQIKQSNAINWLEMYDRPKYAWPAYHHSIFIAQFINIIGSPYHHPD